MSDSGNENSSGGCILILLLLIALFGTGWCR